MHQIYKKQSFLLFFPNYIICNRRYRLLDLWGIEKSFSKGLITSQSFQYHNHQDLLT